jgi:phosphatidylserine synthase
MLAFAYLGKYIFEDFKAILSQYLNIIFSILFLVLGLFQLAQFSVKQYRLIKK